MKRIFLLLIFVLSAFLAYGQSTPMDIILVLDTSSGMSSSNENVNSYITGPFLSEYLRVGDTFHLIAFSSSPRLEIARRVTSIGDAETIIGRMLIQYPIENGSNTASAISFAEQYAASLPSRPKKIVLVGLGSGDTNSLIGAARQRLASRNASIDFVQVTPGRSLSNLPSSGRSGATGTAPSVPVAAASSSPAPAASSQLTTQPAATSAAQQPATQQSPTSSTTPAVTQQSPTSSTTPAVTQQSPTSSTTPAATQQSPTPSTTPAATQQTTGTAQQTAPVTPLGTNGTETTVRSDETTSPVVTETTETGIRAGTGITFEEETQGPVVESGTRESDTVRHSPLLPEEQDTNSSLDDSSLPFIIGMIVLALIILGTIVFFSTRRLGSSPNRVMAQAASKKSEPRDASVDHSKDLAKYAAVQSRKRSTPYDNMPVRTEGAKAEINPSGPLLLNLFVEDQNTAIGKRNIHSLKSGYSLSVGGGNSDFLIFLVPIPSHIGEIRREGSQCTFIPKKPKYFPELGSSELRDCINKTIRVISDKNYELRFRFEMYEDPLIALNRVLMSVNVPG